VLIDDLIAEAPPAPPAPTLSTQVKGEGLIDDLIASTGRRAVEGSEDLERILALPRRAPPVGPAAAEWLAQITDHMTRFLRRPDGPCRCRALGLSECITRLFPVQAAALFEAPRAGGELGLIGVGHGKTGLDILLPMVMPGCKTALLFIPSSVRAQFFKVDYPAWSQHFRTPVLAGTQPPWDTGVPVLHVMAYSELSNPKSTDVMTRINPDLIITDEGHKWKNGIARGGTPPAAGAGRGIRYLSDNEVAFCTHSGSITTKSPSDYTHLSAFALRDGSPLPIDPDVAQEWATVIEPSPRPVPMGELARLCRPGEHVREAFRRRLVETPGVIATEEAAVRNDLVFRKRRVAVPDQVRAAIRGTRDADERPDGEILVDEFARSKCLRELACGFYYRWCFPRGELVSVIEKWFAYRKAWMKELRDELRYSAREHRDSPYLLMTAAKRWHEGYWYTAPDAERQIERLEARISEIEDIEEPEPEDIAERAGLGAQVVALRENGKKWHPPRAPGGPLTAWPSACWPLWAELREQVQPATETVWLSEYLAEDAAAWAAEQIGIVWYEHDALGRKIAQLGRLAHFGGGDEASATIIHEKADRSIVASIRAHGTGKNLQRFSRSLVTVMPGDAGACEQLVGRTHRYGQRSDSVGVWYYAHTQEIAGTIERARAGARYVEETTGSRQKLCIGRWE
jgi:hypothetical protein